MGTSPESKQAAQSAMAGVAELRSRRGSEQVAFDQVADHLVDFAASFPADRDTVDRLAAFLAQVEGIDHDHRAPAGSAGV